MLNRLRFARLAGALLVAGTCLPIGNCVAAETPRTTAPELMKGAANRHEEYVRIAKAGGTELLFVGDSITDFWRRSGKAVWAKYFAPLKAANFGIASEATQNVLWRMANGELAGHPRLVVLLVGTNNIGDKPENIAAGIQAIITEIQKQSPGTRILLLGLFPRGPNPDSMGREKIKQVNKIISTYAHPDDPKQVVYLDLGDKFLNPDGTMKKDLLPDTLHPSERGYQLWADAIIDPVKRLLQ